MRSFIITLVLLAAMLVGLVVNHLYINNVAKEMLEMLEALPDIGAADCTERANELLDFWNKRVPTVEISVSFTLLDKVSEQASLLVACAACGDLYGYRSALELLRDAIEDLRRPEQLSLGNIF